MPSVSIPTLESLKRYASSQTQRIRSSPSSLFRQFNDERWEKLHSCLWGCQTSFDHKHSVERDSSPDVSKDPILSGFNLPDDCDVMIKPKESDVCWSFKCEKILIRSEYKAAKEFALSACGRVPVVCEALLVTGQPGIGKSIFLFRIFLRRLTLKLPTVLQTRTDRVLLFCEDGVKEFMDPKDEAAYNSLKSEASPTERIWALVDPSRHLFEPAPVLQGGPFFVVEAISPRPQRADWAKKAAAKSFYMKPWSFEEVLQARSLINPGVSEKHLWLMYNKYGASTRNMFQVDDPRYYERQVDNEVAKLSLERLDQLLQDPAEAEESSHYLISTIPSQDTPALPKLEVASPYILNKISIKIFTKELQEIRQFYTTLRGHSDMGSSAGVIFEYLAHRYLQREQPLTLFMIHGRKSGNSLIYDQYRASRRYSKTITLSKMSEVLIEGGIKSATAGRYYRPLYRNFPSVDSWTITKAPRILLRFQITLNKNSHPVKSDGLTRVDELSGKVSDRYLVIVTPEGIRPKISVPTTGLDVTGRNPPVDTIFPVYHLPISEEELFKQ